MNHYEEGINAMLEEVEGKKPESIHQPSDKERWKEFNTVIADILSCQSLVLLIPQMMR